MYKKYMGKFQVTKDHNAVTTETLFFDTKEEIKEFVKQENVRV